MENTKRKITNGHVIMVDENKGKRVNVLLFGKIHPLNIIDGTLFNEVFRYVMHKAKNPRKTFIHDHQYIHENIKRGYFLIDPVNIIL